MSDLQLRNLGPIKRANLSFGDLTVLVGPQATGKSIALQFLRLMTDAGFVQSELQRHGIDWHRGVRDFFDVYFGGGMRSIWNSTESRVTWKGEDIDVPALVGRKRRKKTESLFFIPAQRVLALREGWPRPFTDYSVDDPFAVRLFSEQLRLLLDQEFRDHDRLYPQERRLKLEFRDLLARTIFGKFALKVDRSQRQKRLVLGAADSKIGLPYMVWSTGQREFVPLLLGLYWLLPPTKVSRRADFEWVVIEELEMGLHPRAINVALLLVFELLSRGYKVCISTHSPQVLEAIWAIKILQSKRADPKALLEMFSADLSPSMISIAERTLSKSCNVFYFGRKGISRDISELDPTGEGSGGMGWGGLVEFSARANAAVARAVANASEASAT